MSDTTELLRPIEKTVVIGIARNRSYKDIGDEMGVGRSRIANLVTIINARLGVSGCAAITHWAIQNKLVKLGDYEK